jgi:hypothetical protein
MARIKITRRNISSSSSNKKKRIMMMMLCKNEQRKNNKVNGNRQNLYTQRKKSGFAGTLFLFIFLFLAYQFTTRVSIVREKLPGYCEYFVLASLSFHTIT